MSLPSPAALLSKASGKGDGNNMRGLVQFIADLRNARARDLEEKRINKELANIRQKFRDGKLTGYDRKKYICKLLYIYILGWNVDFGHLEAVKLISSNKYTEKQIGYLAVTLLLHEDHELLPLVVNSIRKDLNDPNEHFNCLALHAIANVGGREMGEALSNDVHRLLISPASQSFVKKKAALTLLRLYRRNPDIVQQEWSERMISLMDDSDLGVTLSVTSLVMALAQDRPDQYKGSYNKAAQRLKRIVINRDVPEGYFYYAVPCPWLQVKLLRLLQYYPPSTDTHVRELIRESIREILQQSIQHPKNVQQNNAQNAVLFEAINLVIHLDTERELMVQISSRLGHFIQSRETNVRYLGLDAMTHLAARTEALEPIKRHQNIILGSLRDRDISVRRKGLDLIYSMCDMTNSQAVVNELMKFLQTADYAIREEMVLKIAILTEKYATDPQWYVNLSMRLIAMAGDSVSDEIWQRVIQIVTNNENLQVYAATHILEYIKVEQCHETLTKIGAYLLGEFGHLIADNPGCSPIEQFAALQSKLPGSSIATKAIILSAFVKFVNLFPEIKPQLLQIFTAYSYILDAELQQRACEYLALATMPDDELLRTVCDEMPPFPERSSALLTRLHGKQTAAGDRKTWVIGGKNANDDAKEVLIAQRTGLQRTASENLVLKANGAASPALNGALSPNSVRSPTNGTPAEELRGIDFTTPADTLKTPKTPNFASAAHLSPGWEKGFQRLMFADSGILYQDPQIQIGLRSEYRGSTGVLILYYTNRTGTPIGSFTTTLDSPSPEKLSITVKNLPPVEVAPEQQVQQTIVFEAKTMFSDPPTIRISYLAGSLQAVTLKVPVLPHRYMTTATLSGDDFFKRWKQIGPAPREAQRIFGPKTGASMGDATWLKSAIAQCGWGVLSGVDPNERNVVAAGVLSTSTGGKYGCLLRLEPNAETKMYRITIRATDEAVPTPLTAFMEDLIAKGPSSRVET